MEVFGSAMVAHMKAGRTAAIPDVRLDPLTAAAAVTAAYESVGARAVIKVPLVRGTDVAAVLFVHHPEPRRWSAEGISLVEEIGGRLWSVLERARAEARLRESEVFHRLTTEASGTGAWSLDLAGSVCKLSPMMAELLGFPPDRRTAGPVLLRERPSRRPGRV